MIDLLLHNLRTIGTHHCDGTVGEEAADEIERLRAEVAGLRAELLKSLADNAPLRERVKVLEDALRGMVIAVLAARKGEA